MEKQECKNVVSIMEKRGDKSITSRNEIDEAIDRLISKAKVLKKDKDLRVISGELAELLVVTNDLQELVHNHIRKHQVAEIKKVINPLIAKGFSFEFMQIDNTEFKINEERELEEIVFEFPPF